MLDVSLIVRPFCMFAIGGSRKVTIGFKKIKNGDAFLVK